MKTSTILSVLLHALTGIFVSTSASHVTHLDALQLQWQITQVIELLQDQKSGTARIINLLEEEHKAVAARAYLLKADDGGSDDLRPASYSQEYVSELARLARAAEETRDNTKVAAGLG